MVEPPPLGRAPVVVFLHILLYFSGRPRAGEGTATGLPGFQPVGLTRVSRPGRGGNLSILKLFVGGSRRPCEAPLLPASR